MSDKIFLGGTCNESTWRDIITPLLSRPVYNPVVKIWTPDCQAEEIKQRAECDILLYCITPLISGVYSIAEVVEDSILSFLERKYGDSKKEVVFAYVTNDGNMKFAEHQIKSLSAVGKMLAKYDVKTFTSLKETAMYINGIGKSSLII